MIEGHEVVSDRGAVAAAPPEAARVGARILAGGGNAMDAAAATALACNILQPQSSGVGGYVLSAVVLDGASGTVTSLDANSRAPAAAHENLFTILPSRSGAPGDGSAPLDGLSLNEKEYDCRVQDDANVFGPLSVGVPGMMAGIGTLWEKWGRLKWPEIVAPSQKLVEDGFPYARVAGAIGNMESVIRRFDASAEHLMPDGRVPGPDDIWHRPHMDRTLDRAAEAGWRDFYDGQIGRAIADHVSGAGGVLTREDMAAYAPVVGPPHQTTYRGAGVYGAILPNGTLTCLQMLNMLECFDVNAFEGARYWHLLAEIMKWAWRDRLAYLGDPDFADVPVARLLDKDYAADRVASLRQDPEAVDRSAPITPPGGPGGTLHLSAADCDGNVVSATITQGAAFGSCMTVPGTGIVLGHGIARMDPRPGLPNSVGPRKRPLNNTSPMIVRLPDRDVAIGLPGGRRIVSVGFQMAHRVVDASAGALDAAQAPRLHIETREPLNITKSAGEQIAEELETMGHDVNAVNAVGGDAHNAEYLSDSKTVRAGGNTWAAGV